MGLTVPCNSSSTARAVQACTAFTRLTATLLLLEGHCIRLGQVLCSIAALHGMPVDSSFDCQQPNNSGNGTEQPTLHVGVDVRTAWIASLLACVVCLCVPVPLQIQGSIHRRWQHVLVDEVQDINLCQFELVKHIAGPRTKLLVVGDPDQVPLRSWVL